MVRCASVRKKGSLLQCEANALRGHSLCGRHARSRIPVLWSTVHRDRGTSLERLQAVARGWLVRRRLALAGPGVLKRKGLANDEDLFTCETADRQHPFDYFAFEEGGKIWWFEFAGVWQWCSRSHAPVNPYTKTPLSTETRQRLWDNWAHRLRLRLPLPEESPLYPDRLRHRWNILCQMFSSFGFEGVHPQTFVDFGKAEYLSLFLLLKPDLEVVFPVSDPFRTRALLHCLRNTTIANALPSGQYNLQCVYTLLVLMTLHKHSYTMAFSILSALLRC